MSEQGEHARGGTGGENRSVDEDVASRGGEGRAASQASPPIADDAEHGQTQAPAPPDDTGVPSDEELAEEERSAGGEG